MSYYSSYWSYRACAIVCSITVAHITPKCVLIAPVERVTRITLIVLCMLHLSLASDISPTYSDLERRTWRALLNMTLGAKGFQLPKTPQRDSRGRSPETSRRLPRDSPETLPHLLGASFSASMNCRTLNRVLADGRSGCPRDKAPIRHLPISVIVVLYVIS